MTVGKVSLLNYSFEECLCRLFNIDPAPDYPLAAIDYQHPDKNYYLYADPVYLSLQRDTFFLEKKLTADFERKEIMALCESLNKIFQDATRAFVLNDQGQLFLQLKKRPDIKTTLISHIKPKPIELFMPQGDEAMSWHAFMNEIQMFLFDHPINQDRTKRGALSPNSIWFSGGGLLPQKMVNPFTTIFSNDNFLKKIASIDGKISPKMLNHFLEGTQHQNSLLVCEDDQDTDAMMSLIWSDFKKLKIKNLDIYVSYQGQLLHMHNTFIQLFKIWKKANTVKNYFNVY